MPSPEQRLFQGRAGGVHLVLHAQRVVPTSRRSDDVGPIRIVLVPSSWTSPTPGGVRSSATDGFDSVHIVSSVAFDHPKVPAQGPLEGEDIETEHWEDARHWMSIYDDLIRFKLGLSQRVKRELPKLHPVAQKAADVDVTFIETQMEGYHGRLDLWYQRVWQLHGLWLDPDGRVLRHKGREVVLTNREFELLQFLLDHPHRFYTSSQIMGYAWSGLGAVPRRSPQLRLEGEKDPRPVGNTC